MSDDLAEPLVSAESPDAAEYQQLEVGASADDAKQRFPPRRVAHIVAGTTAGIAALVAVALLIYYATKDDHDAAFHLPAVNAQYVRAQLRRAVDSIPDSIKRRLYHPDAALQDSQWRVCTIVQQCNDPEFMVSIRDLVNKNGPASHVRASFYNAIRAATSPAYYSSFLLQDMANLLLGLYQHWAVSCPGHCTVLPDDLLPMTEKNFHLSEERQSTTSFSECATLRQTNKGAYWTCDQSPKMLLYGNLDTDTNTYQINDVFKENEVHPRDDTMNFVSVYGDLQGEGPFGFRFSGHHLDINFQWSEASTSYLPHFVGHNPMYVLPAPPIHTNPGEAFYIWKNLEQVALFPSEAQAIMAFANTLKPEACLPLDQFIYKSQIGGLVPKYGKSVAEINNVALHDLSEADFDLFWVMVQGQQPQSASLNEVRRDLRQSGKLVWTRQIGCQTPNYQDIYDLLTGGDSFLSIIVQAKTNCYYLLLNKLYTFETETFPSNHVHTLLMPCSFFKNPTGQTN